jgi:hypothetical protein
VTRARLGALALLSLTLAASGHREALAQAEDGRSALVVLVPGASFEDLLSIPDVAALARAGGAGLLVNPELDWFDDPVPPGVVRAVIDPAEAEGLPALAERHRPIGSRDEELLIIVVGADPRGDPDAIGGVVVASGDPEELFPDDGEQGALTSASTRRTGVVTGADVHSTLVDFVGAAEDADGEPIEIVGGPPPFELYERYLAQRQMYVPIGTAAAIYAGAAGLAGVACAFARRSVPRTWRRVAGWACLSIPMLATGLLAAGHLHDLTYATAVPMVAIVTVFGTLAFSPLERRDLTLVPAGIGVAVLAFFAVEAILGWSGMLTPLLGGAQLDGGRFHGLPNVAIGLLVGAALWVAQRVRPLPGALLLCGVGLFAGLPLAGSNLGAAVTAFAAAGTWYVVRERARLGVGRGVAVAVGVSVLGGALVLLAHAISPVATHVTEFEREVEGLGGVVERFVDRLRVGFDLIAGSPAALIPVIGLPVALFVALRPPARIRASFERWPAWRDAIVVTLVAGIVAYVANDSGPAAAGLAFGLGLGGMLGVSLLAPEGKMGER